MRRLKILLLRDTMNQIQVNEIREFCRQIISKRKKVTIEELLDLCRNRFPLGSRRQLGQILSSICNGNGNGNGNGNSNGIVKYRSYVNGKRATVYALKDERRSRYCVLCGEEIHWLSPSRFCERCYPKAETIANFFVPLPEW